MTGVFKHTDDDGDLSIFASRTEVLFVCSKGHWWVVDAKDTGTTAKASAKRVGAGEMPKRLTKTDKVAVGLGERFGPRVFDAMTFK